METTTADVGRQRSGRRVPETAIWAAVVVVIVVLVIVGRTGASSEDGVCFIATGRADGTPVQVSLQNDAEPGSILAAGALVVAGTRRRPDGWAYLDEIETGRAWADRALPWYGAYARTDELRVASFDQIADYGLPVEGSDGTHFYTGFANAHHAWFSREGEAEWTALLRRYVRHSGPSLWVYRRGDEGHPSLEFSRALQSHSLTMVRPRIAVITAADGQGPPVIAHYDPRPALALWKWDGAQ